MRTKRIKRPTPKRKSSAFCNALTGIIQTQIQQYEYCLNKLCCCERSSQFTNRSYGFTKPLITCRLPTLRLSFMENIGYNKTVNIDIKYIDNLSNIGKGLTLSLNFQEITIFFLRNNVKPKFEKSTLTDE
jgi:hypothetical protein